MDNTEMGDIRLKLGDIIQVESPSNPDLHQNTFIIDYIDDSKIALINVANLKKTLLTINADGGLSDESITSILLMDRSDEEGYARQNGLLPHVWLDVYIGGDTPTVITGEITNLEDDMIEIVTFPERTTIYINFEYKGIPEHIPFNKFVIRSKPISAPKESLTPIEEQSIVEEDVPLDKASSMEVTESGDMVINVAEDAIPDDDIRDVLHTMYLDANEIVFGDELEDIVQMVELPEHQKKYSIEVQANDLMDELLSTIPNDKRTKRVMNDIHVLIERFKQLRSKFSKFDTNMNVIGFTQNGILHKPLIEKIRNLSTKLQWIVPVVSQKRKIYTGMDEYEMNDDVIQTSVNEELTAQIELMKQYTQGSQHGEKYSELYANMDKYNTPFVPSDSSDALTNQEVLTEIDAIVNNLGKFTSSVSRTVEKSDNEAKKEFSYIDQRRFVIQRYNLGLLKKDTVLMRSGKVVYIRNNMTPNDTMTLKSLLILPEPVMKFSQIDLPGTNIMTRANLHQNYFSLFRLLRQKTAVSTHVVDDLDNEIKYDDESDRENDDDEENRKYESKDDSIQFMKTIKEYVLDEKYENEPEKFAKFLRTVVPKTRVIFRLLRKYIKNKMSFVEIVKELEPFLVYSDDIAFNQFKEIRYYIKQQMTEYIKRNEERAEHLRNLSGIKDGDHPFNFIENVFLNDDKMGDLFEAAYSSKDGRVPTSELLFKLMGRDGCTLFADVISVLSIKELVNPENIINEFEPSKIDDMEYVKSKDCTRRYLAKRYSTMKALQMDNNNEDVFYDQDLDDTPYKLLDAYVKERKNMSAEVFIEFVTETLVQKHSVQPDYAAELAQVLIEGKKRIRDGEFAVLVIQPTLPPGVDATEKEKQDMEIEAKARQKVGYYHRVKNHWVHDQTIDEEAFVDTNTLFCNIQAECFKNQSNNVCEPSQNTKKRMDELTKARMVKEFENRVNMSLEQLIQKGKTELDRDYKRVVRQNTLREVAMNRFSIYAYELGKTSITTDAIVSPHALLRDLILGQDDFVKKQADIVKLVDIHCREPMAELKEDSFWLYCRDTNTKLVPQSLYRLAMAFVMNTDYLAKLDEICAAQGTMSDDGDAIVDKHSGYVLRKIDFVTEEGYIDGFKIVTHDVIEQDLTERLADMFAPKPKPIFENESNEMVYNIVDSICTNMGIPTDSIQEFVMRTALELMERNIQTSEKYEEIADAMFKKKNQRPIPYEIYRNRFMFWIIASCILIAIQTAIPSFRVKKTYPGCVRSFSGYPLDGGVEDITGIKYIACVMKKMESPTVPWNSIEKLDANAYATRIKETLEKFIMSSRIDINDLYVAKQKYILEHPNEVIPEEHSVDKWRAFLPPIVKYKMGPITSISKDFERDFYEVMTKGHKEQHASLNVIKSRCSQMGFGIIEAINRIVQTKDPILKTASKDPFLENACCNESQISRPMDYFIKDDSIIQNYIDTAAHLGELSAIAKELARPTTIYHNEFTGVIRTVVTETITDEHVYLAFIDYCNFTNDVPIPDEYLTVCATKPIGFPVKAPLMDQIEFLKKNGKRYTATDLQDLMTLVRNKHRVELPKDDMFSQINVMYDLLDAFDARASIVIDVIFRDNLRAVLNSYNPKVMVVEERKELKNFKNYLASANERMYYEIVKFFDQYGNLGDVDYDRLQNFLLSVTTTNLRDADALYTVTSFVKNSIYMMCTVYPEMILNGNVFDKIPKHWELSSNHISDLGKKIESYWSSIQEFHGDPVISRILQNIQINSSDIFVLIREMPVFSPLAKGGNTYYSLFDNETINMVFIYLWYSALYEYTVSASNPEFLRTDVEEKKNVRRKDIINAADQAAQTVGVAEEESDIQEIDIRIGNSAELKIRVAKLLLTFLDIEQGNKKHILSYEEIAKKIRKEKNIEKQKIIEYLGNMDKEERQIEDQFKRYKMGRWNVGLQKGLVQYDKKTYDRETTGTEGAGELMNVDAEQLEQMANAEANEAEDNEAMDISQLGEDYQDGDYYGEDDDE